MSLISCNDVTFAYEGKNVITGLNFNVEKGDYLCIVGENGSGKSTLIKGILQLKAATNGSLTLGDGLQLNEIGYLPQQTNVQKDFPAELSHVEYLKKSSLYEAGGVGTMQRAFTNVESTFPQEDCDENMWSRISPRFGRILNEDQFLGFFVDLR